MAEPDRLYLDHAATTPMLPEARAAWDEGVARWANPSSPHAEGRAARAALEDARRRVAKSLDWDGEVIFTSGASEAIAIALGRAKADRVVTSPVEHDSVIRLTKDAERLAVDENGTVALPLRHSRESGNPSPEFASSSTGREMDPRLRGNDGKRLFAIQHANSETGVIQPLDTLANEVHAAGDILFADCAQTAAKLPLPPADLIAIGAHKFGGPSGVGALLVRDLALLKPVGGQEQGYRPGTENLPGALAMAAALEAPRTDFSQLRAWLDTAIVAAGGEVIAGAASRIPTIASYRMPGVPARAQLIRFDIAGIAVSAGSACSSGTLKSSPVLAAMGIAPEIADEVIRVSFGTGTDQSGLDRFMAAWREIAG